MTSCCSACRATSNGCQGGYPTQAFNFYGTAGIVSGGLYGSNDGCKPYPVQPGAKSQPTTTPCAASCRTGFNTAYSADKKKGGSYQVYSMENEAVMQEIYDNGPVVATFIVYEDLYHYKSGVYQYTTGNRVGGHAVRLIGWGETADGTPFWRVANSWGTAWGDHGYFNIIRGTNDCEFEEGFVSGVAL
jgi:cathepsin B